MKTIVIGDIHTHVDWIEPFLSSHPHDSVIFLGDYFDSFGDTLETTEKTAEWLAESVTNENRIHLMGNHDMPYRFPDNGYVRCPGFTENKLKTIDTYMTDDHWLKIKLAHFDHDNKFIFSHAGLTEDLFNCCPVNGPDLIAYEKMIDDTLDGLVTNPKFTSPIIGEMGITWIRPENIKLIPNVTQVVGHTPTWLYTRDAAELKDGCPLVTSENGGIMWNIDCAHTWVGVFEGGKFYGLDRTNTDITMKVLV